MLVECFAYCGPLTPGTRRAGAATVRAALTRATGARVEPAPVGAVKLYSYPTRAVSH